MQTFLPYKSFISSAKVLDMKRLGKQRVETMQIMTALARLQLPEMHAGQISIPWGNHPATRMWLGYEWALMSYQVAMCEEWTGRGYNDSCLDKTKEIFDHFPMEQTSSPRLPYWLGKKVFHSAHRANLLRKDPIFYGRFGWTEEPQEGYWWPREMKVPS